MLVTLSWTSDPLECSPFECVESARPSYAALYENVTSCEVLARHSSMPLPLKRGPDADMFSSSAHERLQWSTITWFAETVPNASGSQPLRLGCPSAPVRMRMWRTITWLARMFRPVLMSVMPGEGAVCPAMLRLGSRLLRPL